MCIKLSVFRLGPHINVEEALGFLAPRCSVFFLNGKAFFLNHSNTLLLFLEVGGEKEAITAISVVVVFFRNTIHS